MTNLAQRLDRELAELSSDYQNHFAGRSRVDRDVALLDKMIARATEAVSAVTALPDAVRSAELNKLLEQANIALKLYQTEKREIAQAKTVGPSYSEFGEHAGRANFVFSRYNRHFAGQSRSSRDVGLLSELISDLDRIHRDMKAVAKSAKNSTFDGDIKLVADNKASYEKERGEIEKVRNEGDAEARANRLAGLANGQFSVYRVHFAGASRVSRRPVLLARTIETLKKLESDMVAIEKAGFTAEFHTKNLAIVREQLKMYESEIEEIRKVRKATSLDDLMGALGDAANKLFQEYRDGYAGKNRKDVNREKLSEICDRVGEVLRQMDELSNAHENDMNERNRQIVVDQLAAFEAEYEQVTLAQRPS